MNSENREEEKCSEKQSEETKHKIDWKKRDEQVKTAVTESRIHVNGSNKEDNKFLHCKWLWNKLKRMTKRMEFVSRKEVH